MCAQAVLQFSARTLFISPSAQRRVARATNFVLEHCSRGELLCIGATREAADDLARDAAARNGVIRGLQRFSLTQLAARLAMPVLAGERVAPLTGLAAEALAAMAAFEERSAGRLSYFAPVSGMPGFPRALARSVNELRLAGYGADVLCGHGEAGADLARLLARYIELLDVHMLADRARLFEAATHTASSDAFPWPGVPLLLLDVPVPSRVERNFVRALIDRAPDVLITATDADHPTQQNLRNAPVAVVEDAEPVDETSGLSRLRAYLFSREQPPASPVPSDVQFFSAPGEARECVEVARRILKEAEGGVPFDRIAVAVRSNTHYQNPLSGALARAGIPAWFHHGTRRPEPAGRAFLSLLLCGADNVSVQRFTEYLSLAQVPLCGSDDSGEWAPPRDEVYPDPEPDETGEVRDAREEAGQRAPWVWERLLHDAAILGGRERWHRRLAGLREELLLHRAALERDDPQSPRLAAIDWDLQRLEELQAFALPVVDTLADWPAASTWGDWLLRFEVLASRVLVRPQHVLEVLAELRPMSRIGPVSLADAVAVLSDRLRNVTVLPDRLRYGAVFIGTPEAMRGRSFDVVFAVGLAERLFPERPRQDPLLLDEHRQMIGGLTLQLDRDRVERAQLRLIVGAASERLYLSYPRMEVLQARPRVPSTYALDLQRGLTGQVPPFQQIERAAAEASGARLAWPATPEPLEAVDGLEHDLATIRPLLDARGESRVGGAAHYLLQLTPFLRRSITQRWSRWDRRWSPHDGITRAPDTVTAALAPHRLRSRPYSVSSLQLFASCPYRFLLSAIHRLRPREAPQPLRALDPLTRGSIVHEVQARLMRDLKSRGALPVSRESLELALDRLDAALEVTVAEYHDKLAPAIERVWQEEIATIRLDLRTWLREAAASDGQWVPEHFEFAFGLPRRSDQHDPDSVPDPVLLDERFLLHGAIDVIERHASNGTLRITDHKTGRNRVKRGGRVSGGTVLQPILYSLAVEQVFASPVSEARLYFCTTPGNFESHAVQVDTGARKIGIEVLEIIDRAVEQGHLPAYPIEGACRWCDFTPICGPHEERRIVRKAATAPIVADLIALREQS